MIYKLQFSNVYTSKKDFTCTKKKENASAGGFFLEEEHPSISKSCKNEFNKDEEASNSEEEDVYSIKKRRKIIQKDPIESLKSEIQLLRPPDQGKLVCNECERNFEYSFLMEKFDCEVCDVCHDPKDTHTLITRTTAKSRYLLSDVDLDQREPVLKYLLKANPRNKSWGDMRLYLEAQVVDRALELHGSEEGLEAKRKHLTDRRENSRIKGYEKRLKELRVQTRSSRYVKKNENHTHDFGAEIYNPESDNYSKTCNSCKFVTEYEKL
ncbi:hypothetical protein Ciccas_000103 [Cichlidogyrus casuarinus]|uniref:XPA C-terminal domain-containing protein n=1 Tax=Cichlidogyrus casuarinus TaxID=1844966 RepID=A0ABD2QNX9_9PLAT